MKKGITRMRAALLAAALIFHAGGGVCTDIPVKSAVSEAFAPEGENSEMANITEIQVGETIYGIRDGRAAQDIDSLTEAGRRMRADVDGLRTAVSAVSKMVPSPNIFTGYTVQGGIDNTTGADRAVDTSVRTDYIPVDASRGTLYVLRNTSGWAMRIFFYDADRELVSPDAEHTNAYVFASGTTAVRAEVNIPDGAAYIRSYRAAGAAGDVSIAYTEQDTVVSPDAAMRVADQMVSEDSLDDALAGKINGSSEAAGRAAAVEAELAKIEAELTKAEALNLFDNTFPESGYFDENGADAAGANFQRSAYIPVDAENDTLFFLRTAQPYQVGYCFYDAEGTGLGRAKAFSASSTELTLSVPIPPTAVSVRLYTSAASFAGGLMLSYSRQSGYVPYGSRYALADGIVTEKALDSALKEKVNSGAPFCGKTIAFLGDSIIGNFSDDTGVCAVMAEHTGATVINCAFGGSRMAYRYLADGADPSDLIPFDSGNVPEEGTVERRNLAYQAWNALSGVSLAQAVASGDWTYAEYAVDWLTAFKSTPSPNYFAARLAAVKAVDWNQVDFILWEYGTNDFMTKVRLTDTEDTSNLCSFDNAYRAAIEAILTAYPNIRIIPVTPIYRWYQADGAFTDDSSTHEEADYAGTRTKLTDFVAMVQTIALEYQLPCIDDYYTLGANRFTRLAYFDATDGTHPNAQGRERIAEHIASQLDSVV